MQQIHTHWMWLRTNSASIEDVASFCRVGVVWFCDPTDDTNTLFHIFDGTVEGMYLMAAKTNKHGGGGMAIMTLKPGVSQNHIRP